MVDPKDSHGSPTVGNRIQHVQSQGLAHPQSNTGEHMSVTHRCATAFWLSLPVPSQNKGDVLLYDLGPGEPQTSKVVARQYLGHAKCNTPHSVTPLRNICLCLHHVGMLFVFLSGAMSEENVIVCSVVNADSVNVEAPSSAVIQSRLQQILAQHCVAHREQSYIQPNEFKTGLEHVFPAELQLNPRNKLFYTLLCKRFSIKNKATMACIGDYTPSKHETVGGTAYRNLAISVSSRRPHTSRGTRGCSYGRRPGCLRWLAFRDAILQPKQGHPAHSELRH